MPKRLAASHLSVVHVYKYFHGCISGSWRPLVAPRQHAAGCNPGISLVEAWAWPHLVVALIIHVSRQEETRRQEQLPLHHLRLDELLQVGPTQAAVPVVRDVTSVHDLPEQVAQVIVRDLGIREKGCYFPSCGPCALV